MQGQREGKEATGSGVSENDNTNTNFTTIIDCNSDELQRIALTRSSPAINTKSAAAAAGRINQGACISQFSQHLSARMATSMDDIKSPYFWRATIAELVGTMLLVFLGCGSCMEMHRGETVQIGLSFGLAVATVVWIIGHVSGGHVNPAVTIAMLVTRKVSLVRGILYVIAQVAGAVIGAAILNGVTHQQTHDDGVKIRNASVLGVTQLNNSIDISAECGFVIELIITFTLVFTVFATCDSKRDDLHGSRPLAIGLSVTVCHFFAVPYTGSSMNPARSFGPVVITGLWANHWIYWVGPITGGILAALLYEAVFASNASLVRTKGFFTESKYDPSAYESRKGLDRTIIIPGNGESRPMTTIGEIRHSTTTDQLISTDDRQ